MFRTQYDRRQVLSNPGSRFHPTYEMMVDLSGVHEFVQTGQIDTYEQIQSHRDSVDIHKLLERFANGDQSALNQKKPMFGDFTEMPKTMAEFQQTVLEAEKLFDSLPAEKKALFNHSISEFVAAFGTEKFFEAFGIETKIDTNVLINKNKEVKDEQKRTE